MALSAERPCSARTKKSGFGCRRPCWALVFFVFQSLAVHVAPPARPVRDGLSLAKTWFSCARAPVTDGKFRRKISLPIAPGTESGNRKVAERPFRVWRPWSARAYTVCRAGTVEEAGRFGRAFRACPTPEKPFFRVLRATPRALPVIRSSAYPCVHGMPARFRRARKYP